MSGKSSAKASAAPTKAPPVPVEHIPRPEVDSWGAFQDEVEAYLDGRHIFRGVNDVRHQLLPAVGRRGHEGVALRGLEERLLSRFKREAIPYLHSPPRDEWQWLALAQHHGTPTRLLDWSESPYVSLYFAVSGHDDLDAGLFIVPRPDDLRPADMRDPFNISEDVYFFPDHAAPRISAQRGLFTAHPNPAQVYSPQGVRQIVIKAAAKPDIRRKLDAIGIHDAQVYADLDGLSRRLVALEGYAMPSQATVSALRKEEALKAPGLTPLPRGKFNPRDPQKGQWGGLSNNGVWEVTAQVSETESNANWFRIELRVAGVAGGVLKRPIRLHLHDSFRKEALEVRPRGGVATEELTAYGAFTVGVEIPDDGSTLELDLADLEGAPDKFRNR